MKVSHPNSGQIQKNSGDVSASRTSQSERVRRDSEDGAAGSGAVRSENAAEISARAKEMARAKEGARFAPEVREELVAKLRDRISKGEYNIKPDKIADRMVDEHLQLRDLG